MIKRDEAIEIARKRAEHNGWAFVEPLGVLHRRGWTGGAGRFEIETNAGKLGSKARFVIDAANGDVIEEGYVPR